MKEKRISLYISHHVDKVTFRLKFKQWLVNLLFNPAFKINYTTEVFKISKKNLCQKNQEKIKVKNKLLLN